MALEALMTTLTMMETCGELQQYYDCTCSDCATEQSWNSDTSACQSWCEDVDKMSGCCYYDANNNGGDNCYYYPGGTLQDTNGYNAYAAMCTTSPPTMSPTQYETKVLDFGMTPEPTMPPTMKPTEYHYSIFGQIWNKDHGLIYAIIAGAFFIMTFLMLMVIAVMRCNANKKEDPLKKPLNG